ncbi:hypothetical protein BO70DRAFT_60442 [Aspergillus heteromorphus CBS 117.55]|uniref:Uncharacterized protein n=1 Tax=Aspergillus heteromorphus CBS 117.55 TaxID=1448321 RepID=A0A317VV24_9EURO|nr:uncharacterized protein BO70DRAFT_60442 [Aspergillus heteromorphus CBS 117.55]PWY78254.1 hypothetical protein BO70DRAFT_60442 [Aspergillus heteromorphus CBS 117.55]
MSEQDSCKWTAYGAPFRHGGTEGGAAPEEQSPPVSSARSGTAQRHVLSCLLAISSGMEARGYGWPWCNITPASFSGLRSFFSPPGHHRIYRANPSSHARYGRFLTCAFIADGAYHGSLSYGIGLPSTKPTTSFAVRMVKVESNRNSMDPTGQ